MAGSGSAGQAMLCPGMAGWGLVGFGVPLARSGRVSNGAVRSAPPCNGEVCWAKVAVRQALAWCGEVRCGAVWLGQAVPGWARHALARRGVERPGRARIKQYLKVVRRAQER